ncbi:MAG: hypothetical protein FWC97_03385 [Treponema sp.]|nr:hypothetical protein [Treponema sp.]
MSTFRSFLLLLITLLVSTGLFFIARSMVSGELRGGYAVLSTDVSTDYKMLSSLFPDVRKFAHEPVSESSLWVMLDNFEYLEKVPLFMFFDRILYFDPRNDGFAEKLRDIFIRDGRRYVFIPLKYDNWNPTSLDRQFVSLFEGIPFYVDYFGVGRPVFLFFIMYALASIGFLVICYAKRKHNRKVSSVSVFKLALLLPIFSSLAFFGHSGIISTALLFAFFILIKDPLADYFGQKDSLGKRDFQWLKPYWYYLVFIPIFAAAFAGLIVFFQVRILFLLLIFTCAFLVFFFSLKIQFTDGKHKRFNPIMIKKRRSPDFSYPKYVLPFAFAAVLTTVFYPLMSDSPVSNENFYFNINEQDYYNHLEFQASFSTRQLGLTPGGTSGGFYSFVFDADGFPVLRITPVNQAIDLTIFPPFPSQLRNLIEFFHGIEQYTVNNRPDNIFLDNLSLLLLPLFFLASFLVKKANEHFVHADFSGYRITSGKIRFMGINWNKALLYNDRNQKRGQKGTARQNNIGWESRKDA